MTVSIQSGCIFTTVLFSDIGGTVVCSFWAMEWNIHFSTPPHHITFMFPNAWQSIKDPWGEKVGGRTWQSIKNQKLEERLLHHSIFYSPKLNGRSQRTGLLIRWTTRSLITSGWNLPRALGRQLAFHYSWFYYPLSPGSASRQQHVNPQISFIRPKLKL